ncbi:MAG: 2-C-methyl-D-erythritol 2,4-cyclodiphosphate synthase [Defluviitoga tunisiensis]|jgi:2-C-methyl-D-erythritol 2,4-cyclodiphosphate synthase
MLKIGFGYDVHPFEQNRKLIVGGVEIKHPKDIGLYGHSDADVLFHALIDALLGMCGMGSIGELFPETDEYKNINSRVLLDKTCLFISKKYRVTINNIDCTVISKSVRIAPVVEDMKNNISQIIKIPTNMISIKGKSGNGLGIGGTDQGIEAYCVVLGDIIEI